MSGGIRSFRRDRETVEGELRLSSERQARKVWLDSKCSRDSVAQMVGWCSGGQAEMSKNFGNHRRVFNGGDDL